MPEFCDRTLVIASMHRKEAVIAPRLEAALGVRVLVPDGFDTDQFGTFTRDRDRPAGARVTARLKAEAALALTGETLAIASEGSFGPHPGFPMVPGNHEWVVLLDQRHNLEIAGQALSLETNFQHRRVTSVAEAIAFATSVGFPSHGLVIQPADDLPTSDHPGLPNAPRSRPPVHPSNAASMGMTAIKGITSEAHLVEGVTRLLRDWPSVWLETDMRALYNPSRMAVIAQATEDLLRRLRSRCPRCQRPGFDEQAQLPGLPCEDCGAPTRLPLHSRYHCEGCGWQELRPNVQGLTSASAMYCDYCNP